MHPDWKDKFLKILSETGNVSEACRRVKITSGAAYNERARNLGFDLDWQKAVTPFKHQETPKYWEDAFLNTLRETGIVTKAAQEAGISVNAVNKRRINSHEFRRKYDDALAEGKKTKKRLAFKQSLRWKQSFLMALRNTGCVVMSCDRARVHPHIVYAERKRNRQFAEDWEIALERAVDDLQFEAFKRAKEYSDGLLKFLLSAHRPKLYRENYDPYKFNYTPEELDAMSDEEFDELYFRRYGRYGLKDVDAEEAETERSAKETDPLATSAGSAEASV